MAGRPPKDGGAAISTERTRARNPRARDAAVAVETMRRGDVPGGEAGGARIFSLYGGPVESAGAAELEVAADSVALDWYRQGAGGKRG